MTLKQQLNSEKCDVELRHLSDFGWKKSETKMTASILKQDPNT